MYFSYSIEVDNFHQPKAYIVKILRCEKLDSKTLETRVFPVLNPNNPNRTAKIARQFAVNRCADLRAQS